MSKTKKVDNLKGGQETAARDLAPLAKEINHRLEQAATIEGKADDHRLTAALRLAEAKSKCEKAKINFKKWCLANIKDQSFETIRKLTAVGQSKNPQLAIEDMRGKNRNANKKHRARTKAAATLSAPEKDKTTPVERARITLTALEDKGAIEVMKSHAKGLGFAVVPQKDADELAAARRVQKAVEADGHGIEALKKVFKGLKPSEQMAFVSWSAAEIGVKLSNPLTDEMKDDLDIPASMRRAKTTETSPEPK